MVKTAVRIMVKVVLVDGRHWGSGRRGVEAHEGREVRRDSNRKMVEI